MTQHHLNYLPLSPFSFSLLALLLAVLAALIGVGVLRSAYMQLGLGRFASTLLLLASLIGAYVNIPLYELPAERVLSGREVVVYGMVYVVPEVADWPGTLVAVNLGGAAIPAALSIYLLFRHGVLWRGIVAAAAVAYIVHALAQPVAGVGIAVPVFLPSLAATLVAFMLSRRLAAPLAYIGGSMGTLIGADLMNLGKIAGLGAPVASIGGAGTFDGVFVSGIVAVLVAGLGAPRPAPLGRR